MLLRVLVLAVAAALVGAALSTPGRTAIATLLLLPHFFPGEVTRPLGRLTQPPVVTTLTVAGPGAMVADVYRPAHAGKHPAIVLLLGVNPLPRNHEQVTSLAAGLARSGLVTAVAESEALVSGEIGPEEIDNLVALFQQLEQDPAVDPTRIGFAGFCVGAALELLAASDPRIADRVAWINAFSVYADATAVIRAILSQTMPTPAGPLSWTPHETTRVVFTRHLVSGLLDLRERQLLLREFLDSIPLSVEEREALSPAGTRTWELLRATEPAEIDRLLAGLPEETRAQLRDLSPAVSAHRIRAKTFIMHDERDTLLPVSGARELVAAFPADATPTYTEFRLFEHVVPGGTDDPIAFTGQLISLFRHIHGVLSTAYGGRPGS